MTFYLIAAVSTNKPKESHIQVTENPGTSASSNAGSAKSKFTFKRIDSGSSSLAAKEPRYSRSTTKSAMPFFDDFSTPPQKKTPTSSPSSRTPKNKQKENSIQPLIPCLDDEFSVPPKNKVSSPQVSATTVKKSPKASPSSSSAKKKRKNTAKSPIQTIPNGEWAASKRIRIHTSQPIRKPDTSPVDCEDIVELDDELNECSKKRFEDEDLNTDQDSIIVVNNVLKESNATYDNSVFHNNDGWLNVKKPSSTDQGSRLGAAPANKFGIKMPLQTNTGDSSPEESKEEENVQCPLCDGKNVLQRNPKKISVRF